MPKYNQSRRDFLGMVGATAAASITAISTPATAKNNDKLPKGLAKKAARKQVIAASGEPDFGDWNGAAVGKPTTFYRKNAGKGPEHLRSAYVFPRRGWIEAPRLCDNNGPAIGGTSHRIQHGEIPR